MSPAPRMDANVARRVLEQMLLVRRFEEKCAELYTQTKIRGFLHLYIGEEAVAVGAMEAFTDADWIVSHYRDHGHALCRGLSPRTVMAEMFGKVTGCSRGRGGSMHLFDRKLRFLGGSAIVGAGLPLAVGAALGDRVLRRRAITACFFGDGAMAEGAFHESMNLASLWRLPVLFICENNFYAMGTAIDRYQAQRDLPLKARGYAVPGLTVDGMDVAAVRDAAFRLAEEIRESQTPRFLECQTYRFRAHSMYDPELYRSKQEVAEWKKRDPVLCFFTKASNAGLLNDAALKAAEERAQAIVEDAVAFAEASPWESEAELTRFVVSEERS